MFDLKTRDKVTKFLVENRNFKIADFDNVSKEYEDSISNLIHLYIKDSSPHLLQRVVGFKLINKSADGYKAIGDLVINLGKRLGHVLYVYDSGELKIKDLMLLPDKGLIVPATSEWVNKASSSDEDFINLVNSSDIQALSPDLSPFKYSPNKRASYISDEDEIKDAIISLINECPKCCKAFIDLIDKKAEFIKFALNRYGKDTIKEAIKNYKKASFFGVEEFDSDNQLIKSSPSYKIKFYKYNPTQNQYYDDLDSNEKAILKIKGYLIKDFRDEDELFTAKELNNEKIAEVITEPFYSGIYRVPEGFLMFLKNGSFLDEIMSKVTQKINKNDLQDNLFKRRVSKMGVLAKSTSFNNPIIDITYTRQFNVHQQNNEAAKSRLEKLIDDSKTILEYMRSSPIREKRSNKLNNESEHFIILINPHTKEFVPLKVSEKVKSNNLCGCVPLPNYENACCSVVPSSAEAPFVIYNKPNKCSISIPSFWKVIDLGTEWVIERNALTERYKGLVAEQLSKTSSFETKYVDDTYILDNKIRFNDRFLFIKYLMTEKNLSEKQAEHIANSACNKPKLYVLFNKSNKAIEKKAQFPGMMPMAPPQAMPAAQPPQGMGSAGMGGYPAPGMMQPNPDQLNQMMQTQQNQPVDTYLLSSMIEHGGHELIKKYLPYVLKGNSSIAKIALNLAWHKDELMNYYGEEEYETLLDSLNKTFFNVGELYLKLREKKMDIKEQLL